MYPDITKEINRLNPRDCFSVIRKEVSNLNHAVHYHDEYELKLIFNAQGARRLVGNHIDLIDTYELVLIGPNQCHGWFMHQCSSSMITELTIHFHRDMLSEQFLMKQPLSLIKNMLDDSINGVLFSRATAKNIWPKIVDLNKKSGFAALLDLLHILDELSVSRDSCILSKRAGKEESDNCAHTDLSKFLSFMETNYNRQIILADAAQHLGFEEHRLKQMLKKTSARNFADLLNTVRIDKALTMLLETTHSVAEIAYYCGFNTISNFNRIFLKKMQVSPSRFRENCAFENAIN